MLHFIPFLFLKLINILFYHIYIFYLSKLFVEPMSKGRCAALYKCRQRNVGCIHKTSLVMLPSQI